jgi:chemotaxis protein methyltransferase CheR
MEQSRPSIPSASPPPAVVLDTAGYEKLTRDVRSLLGIDLALYRPAQVWRRVLGFASAKGLAGPDELIAKARVDGQLRQAFMDMLTINVSEFFRNADVFERLVRSYLGPMVRSQPSTKVWSAGCSAGYEPYSIAILARETNSTARIQIQATDLDETILATARSGRYGTAQMLGVSAARRARFFTATPTGFEVRPEIRSLVTFARHDLLRDPARPGFDLIACRNVVIYFTDEAKARLYRGFAGALRPGGILFIGATETISDPRTAGLSPVSPGFYQRPE